MFRFFRTISRRNDRHVRLGLEMLEHRELLASSLTSALVKDPALATAAKVQVTPALQAIATPVAKATSQNTLPTNPIAVDRVSTPLVSTGQTDAAKLASAQSAAGTLTDVGPIEAASRTGTGPDLKKQAQTQVASVQQGVQAALDALGFGIAPSATASTNHQPVPFNGADSTNSAPLLTGNAAIDAAITDMFKSPEDVAKDGYARGYNIGDPGQATGQLSFLQGEKIQLGGKKQDTRVQDGDEEHANGEVQELQGGKGIMFESEGTIYIFYNDSKGTAWEHARDYFARVNGEPTAERTTLTSTTSPSGGSTSTSSTGSSQDSKKNPSPIQDDRAGGPVGAPPVINGLKIPGEEETHRPNADVDKLIRGTVALAVSKVNPPPIKPDAGGGTDQGSGLRGGDPFEGSGRTTPVTTFKGPKPSVGPVGPGGPGRGPA